MLNIFNRHTSINYPLLSIFKKNEGLLREKIKFSHGFKIQNNVFLMRQFSTNAGINRRFCFACFQNILGGHSIAPNTTSANAASASP